MRRQQIQLLLLCFAPTLLVVLLSVALLYRRPDASDLVIAAVATILVLTSCLYLQRGLWANVFSPLQRLAQDIPTIEPGSPLPPQPALLEQLSVALEQRMTGLENVSMEEMVALRHENARLNHVVRDLTRDRDEAIRKVESNTGEMARTSVVSGAVDRALAHVIVRANIAIASGSGSDPELGRAAKALAFLAREIANYDYGDLQESTFDLRQITDRAIMNISPLLAPGQRILPFYDAYGHKRFHGNVDMLDALLFNFLLSRLPHRDRDLALHVDDLGDGRIAFNLLPLDGTPNTASHPRLDSLAMETGADTSAGMLSLPLDVDRHFEQPETGLVAIIMTDDERWQASLAARLASMRVQIADPGYDGDLCIATFDALERIEDLRARLAPGTRLLLLDNHALVNLPNTRQLDDPLTHEALAAELHELADASAESKPPVLLVDDNPSNLRLLALHLAELGINVETARDAATALALVTRHEFSLVLLDMHLPDATGIEVAKAIRDSSSTSPSSTPRVALVTARADATERRQLQAAGFDEPLLKPISRDMLAHLLARCGLIDAVHDQRPRPVAIGRETILKVFDETLGLKLANNRADLADELMDSLMRSIESERAEINASFNEGNLEQLHQRVHAFNGGIQYCGVPRLKNAVAKLEATASSGQSRQVRPALTLFNSEIDALLAWYDPDANYFKTSLLRGDPTSDKSQA